MSDWSLFRGTGVRHDGIDRLPPPPRWRRFPKVTRERADTYRPGPEEVEMVNAAIYLRRPLLVTGPPGVGKTSLAYMVAEELGLGPVLRWSISSRSTLADGLYQYDALARLSDENLRRTRADAQTDDADIGRYIHLGPLGTALLPANTPRVLLIDEIDKSDIDLPNDLLHVFEEGTYDIPELVRLAKRMPAVRVLPWEGRSEADLVTIEHGRVACAAFPIVVMTSNAERELPPAFLRRCLRLDIRQPGREKLLEIVASHFGAADEFAAVVDAFLRVRDDGKLLATDQLLNAVFLVSQAAGHEGFDRERALAAILRDLGT